MRFPPLRRRLAINLLVAAIVLSSALSLVTQHEYWPFSPYPMFADLQGPRVVILDIVGVRANGSDDEVPLAPSRRTAIVSGTRYRTALELLVASADDRELHAYLANVARRFEEERGADVLRAVRLYRSRWDAVPQEWPPAKRISRELVSEIDLDH